MAFHKQRVVHERCIRRARRQRSPARRTQHTRSSRVLARVLCAMASCHESISRPTRPHGTLISVQCVAHFFIFTDGSRGDSSVRSGEGAAILVKYSAPLCALLPPTPSPCLRRRCSAGTRDTVSRSPSDPKAASDADTYPRQLRSTGSVAGQPCRCVEFVRCGRSCLCGHMQDIASATPHCHFAIRTLYTIVSGGCQ